MNPNNKQAARRHCGLAAMVLTALAVSACGGSDSKSTPQDNDKFPPASVDTGPESLIVTGFDSTTQDAESLWLANTYLFRLNSKLATTGDGTVDLVNYADGLPVSEFVDFYSQELDICEVNDPANPPAGGGDGSDGNNAPATISGGGTVAINIPSGPWFTFNRGIEDGEFKYTVDNELPGELLPAGATLSIPGDEFPGVASYPLFEPAPPVRLLPDADVPVNAEASYSWIPGSNKTYMQISMLAYNTDDTFEDFAVTCYVRDDGAFSMPPDVIEFVSTTNFRLQARYTRNYNRLDFVDGIVFRQGNAIAE